MPEPEGVTTPDSPNTTARTSPWAVVAMVCSLCVCVPPAVLLAPLLAAKALRDMRTRSGLRGARLAWTAIVLSATFSACYVGGAWWWHVNVRRPMLNGPREALVAGFNGDSQAFADGFAAVGEPDEAQQFLAELLGRYGQLLSMRQGDVDDLDAAPSYRRPVIQYLAHFENGSRAVEAEFIIADDQWTTKWGWMVVRDDELGDLAYPADAFALSQEADQ